MRKLLFGTAIAAFFVAGAASAAVKVEIWDNLGANGPAPTNATLAEAATLGRPDAVTNVGALDFFSGNSDDPSSTIDSYLGTSLGSPVGTNNLDGTFFLFTGKMQLTAGLNNFFITNDDGAELNIDAFSPNPIYSSPGPQGASPNFFSVNAPTSGAYTFELAYAECCGGAAQLNLQDNGVDVAGVPEPATWAMMLVGVFGLGGVLRSTRQRRLVAA
jgi:hypothetical protein